MLWFSAFRATSRWARAARCAAFACPYADASLPNVCPSADGRLVGETLTDRGEAGTCPHPDVSAPPWIDVGRRYAGAYRRPSWVGGQPVTALSAGR
ncbi:hypothetical protein Vgi01_04400 [Micromonospora gifhornensis]|uniref:Uncharacterized protein n=1 Tax=Micromonospora gifhornensis TaxID=84594 RepID=A0ABQ4I786_9ACTN|nr:hypothetical protein Vgi01_04400 [Micromonospora gifhornensis]